MIGSHVFPIFKAGIRQEIRKTVFCTFCGLSLPWTTSMKSSSATVKVTSTFPPYGPFCSEPPPFFRSMAVGTEQLVTPDGEPSAPAASGRHSRQQKQNSSQINADVDYLIRFRVMLLN